MSEALILGVTVAVIFLSIVLCVASWISLREARAILRSTEGLTQSLQRETLVLVKEATELLLGARAEISRVQDLIEINEERTLAVNRASRLAIGAVAAPIVRARALRLGIRRGVDLFRIRQERK